MGMVINNNIAALNTYNKMVINTGANAQSLSKLSSGLRINKAGDDAAGLSISEKMRGQIRGLDQANRNAQDNISLIQTAEGALGETENILQRMRELSVQSANATNTDIDRGAIQSEVDQLKSEVDRIGNTTEFNSKKLLNGDFKSTGGATSGGSSTTGAVVFKEIAASIQSTDNFASANFSSVNINAKEIINIDKSQITIDWASKLSATEITALTKSYTGTAMNATQKEDIKTVLNRVVNESIDDFNKINNANVDHVSIYVDSGSKLVMQSGKAGNESRITWGSSINTNGVIGIAFRGGAASAAYASGVGYNKVVAATTAENVSFEINGVRLRTASISSVAAAASAGNMASAMQTAIRTAVSNYVATASLTSSNDEYIDATKLFVKVESGKLIVSNGNKDGTPVTFVQNEGEKLVEEVGLSAAQTNESSNGGLTFQIGANKGQTINLGVNDMRTGALGIQSLSLTTVGGATSAIETLDKAITKVSGERSKLGAVQNRLEHTINNLTTSSENLTAAESRIRDVDMAKEMMQFTKTNILNQAAQSMMAQANQQPQGVLQLLR